MLQFVRWIAHYFDFLEEKGLSGFSYGVDHEINQVSFCFSGPRVAQHIWKDRNLSKEGEHR